MDGRNFDEADFQVTITLDRGFFHDIGVNNAMYWKMPFIFFYLRKGIDNPGRFLSAFLGNSRFQ